MEFEVSFGTRFLGTVDHRNLFGLSTWKLSGRFLERLWEALGRLGEAWEALGASKLILGPPLGGFGRLWETLGETL